MYAALLIASAVFLAFLLGFGSIPVALFAVALALLSGGAIAQPFPSRPVTLVVPFSPGTGIDILARTLGQKLGERWKVAVVVDNDRSASQYARRSRDGWGRVKAAVAGGRLDLLVTWEASRAQRDLDAYLELRRLCAAAIAHTANCFFLG